MGKAFANVWKRLEEESRATTSLLVPDPMPPDNRRSPSTIQQLLQQSDQDLPSYMWPENLYIEARDMAAASFMVYTFGYVMALARKKGGITGLTTSEATGQFETKDGLDPEQFERIIEENIEDLAKEFGEFRGNRLIQLKKTINLLKERAAAGAEGILTSKSLVLLKYDDKYQTKEMVWAVARDDQNKRITLVFRGTENELAFQTNWATNFSFFKTYVPLPTALKAELPFDCMWLHTGFYYYIFSKTYDDTDDPEKLQFHEILEAIKPPLRENPGYKLYVTGHSLGGALSGLISLFLACDPDIPKPVSCINFASPRIGDSNYRKAVQALEQYGALRFCRFVNDRDAVAFIPSVNYSHAGFQVRLYTDEETKPEITFPMAKEGYYHWVGRALGNNFISGLNVGYDHGDYRERLESGKEYLKKENLNSLYSENILTGFDRPVYFR